MGHDRTTRGAREGFPELKKKLSFILMACFLCVAFNSAAAQEEEAKDVFAGVRLKAESLPAGMEITNEVRATEAEVLHERTKLGFPITALINQTITYEGEQARLSYVSTPNERWLIAGYSEIMKSGGAKSAVFAKDLTLIQMVTTTKALEDWLVRLLRLDRLQAHKIRFHRAPREWTLIGERILPEEERMRLERKSGGKILRGLKQEIIIRRSNVKITYLDCRTEKAADRVGTGLAERDSTVVKRLVRGYGPIVVLVDSSNAELNDNVLSYMNW